MTDSYKVLCNNCCSKCYEFDNEEKYNEFIKKSSNIRCDECMIITCLKCDIGFSFVTKEKYNDFFEKYPYVACKECMLIRCSICDEIIVEFDDFYDCEAQIGFLKDIYICQDSNCYCDEGQNWNCDHDNYHCKKCKNLY
jgi:hypothetical protein